MSTVCRSAQLGRIRRLRVVGASAGLAATAIPAIAVTMTELGPWAWSCVPVACLAGWAFATLPVGSGRARALLRSAIAFGASVGLGGVFAYVLLAELASLLPDSDVARPESPIGYLLFLVLSVAGLAPFATLPMMAVGLVWAAIVRTASQPREQAPASL